MNNNESLDAMLPSDIGIAFNFDQIFKGNVLQSFEKGIINVHASKLPQDKGISPVLWAFARGDTAVWSSIYRIGEGIDAGFIYKQFEIEVKEADTAYFLYERVCKESGFELVDVIRLLENNQIEPAKISNEDEGNYWGWPDLIHKKLMCKSGRKFINLKDIIHALSVRER